MFGPPPPAIALVLDAHRSRLYTLVAPLDSFFRSQGFSGAPYQAIRGGSWGSVPVATPGARQVAPLRDYIPGRRSRTAGRQDLRSVPSGQWLTFGNRNLVPTWAHPRHSGTNQGRWPARTGEAQASERWPSCRPFTLLFLSRAGQPCCGRSGASSTKLLVAAGRLPFHGPMPSAFPWTNAFRLRFLIFA